MGLVGRKIIINIKVLGEEEYLVVEVIDKMKENWFDKDSFIDDVKKQQETPAVVINNTKQFFTYICVETETREILFCNQYDLLYDVTGLSDAKIAEIMLNIESEMVDTQINQPVLGEVNELDNHYDKCIELGYSHEEAIDQLKVLVEEKYKHKK